MVEKSGETQKKYPFSQQLYNLAKSIELITFFQLFINIRLPNVYQKTF